MNFKEATKLRNGDKVKVKSTKEIVTVVSACIARPMNNIYRNQVLVRCDDGVVYHHSKISLL
jgi:hypothetical protein